MLSNSLDDELRRRACRKDYGEYVKLANPGFYMTKFHRYICDNVQEFLEAKTGRALDILLLAIPPRHGKELADSTPVLTPAGWKKHGDLQIGDYVYSPEGRAVKVLNVIHQKEPVSLLVETTDGAKIKAHPHHEWVVYNRRHHCYERLETETLQRLGVENHATGRGHRYMYLLPPVEPLDNPVAALAVDPYVMGVYLGDGRTAAPIICASPDDIVTLEEVRRHYPEGTVNVHKTTGVVYYSYHGLRQGLQTYGMCHKNDKHNKRVPQEYLTASLQQRLELLAGLLDTDGYLDRGLRRYHFTTADETLRDTFIQLIATFGWRTSVRQIEPHVSTSGIVGRRPYWVIAFNPTLYIPCRIERKQLREFSKQRRVAIKSITPCEPEKGRCITVEGGVYLAGERLTPTHNSFTVTETLPSWFLGKHPDANVIIASYESEFSESYSRRNRDKFNEYARDVFRVENNPNAQGVALWETADGGRCRATGLKAGITGFGAELFIIDDPIKNQESAESETILAKLHNEMGPSVQSRIHPGGKLIVIQTRWVENDVIGWIKNNWPEYIWKDINLPCECEDQEHDPLGRKLGDSLMGEHLGDTALPDRVRNDNAWLKDKKKLVIASDGERTWNALYQGHPSAANGNLFNQSWWHLYSRTENTFASFEYTVLSIDATFKKTETSDMVAITLWGIAQNNVYLYKLINKRMGFVETLERIRALFKEHPGIDQLLIEDKANGSAIIDSLRYMEGVPPVVAVNPMGSKYSRAQAVAPFVATGAVHIPCDFDQAEDAEIEWDGRERIQPHERFIAQHTRFPYMAHDDMVDSTTQALTRLIKLITGEEPMPERHYLRFVKWYPDMWEDYENMNDKEQEEFIRTYGAPLEWSDL